MPGSISIQGHQIGSEYPCFIIAEAGVNHNGDPKLARNLISAAKQSGANCVKFQTFKAERVITTSAPKAEYQLAVTDPDETQFDMLRKLELSNELYEQLICDSKQEQIVLTSTPYNEEDLAYLVSVGVPFLKSASIHLAEPRFLQRMAETGLPLIVSTGMATWSEVDMAVEAIRSTGNDQFVLLQCTTNYPSLIEDTNLHAMCAMRERYGCLVGYSDHTTSDLPAIGAVALGACVIEKHFTLDKGLPGPDQATSESPESFNRLVSEIRVLETALGSPDKSPTPAEKNNMAGMRRSLAARRTIKKGSIIGDDDLTSMRPSSGLPPALWGRVVGQTAARTIMEGHLLSWEDVKS